MKQGFLRPDEFDKEWERYESLRINDNIAIETLNEISYWRITNLEPVPWASRTDSAWYIATNATRELGTISDWLEPSGNVAYLLKLGVYSDKNPWIFVRYTGTTGEAFGIQDDPIGRITPSVSPYHSPRVVVKSFPNVVVPSFRLENRTRYTLSMLKISVIGLKLEIAAVQRPEHFLQISMTHLREGGRGRAPQGVAQGA